MKRLCWHNWKANGKKEYRAVKTTVAARLFWGYQSVVCVKCGKKEDFRTTLGVSAHPDREWILHGQPIPDWMKAYKIRDGDTGDGR